MEGHWEIIIHDALGEYFGNIPPHALERETRDEIDNLVKEKFDIDSID